MSGKIQFQLFFIATILLASLTASETCFAQWSPSLIRADYGKGSQIQYSPSDPVTRSRLFKLQTGQAGAFYNCDGEEDKRNSPFICWKSSNGEHCHRTFWDVLDWRGDRSEIAQRICDGAGACCSKGASCKCETCPTAEVVSPAPASCGCQSCVADGSKQKQKEKSVSMLQRFIAAATPGKRNGELLPSSADNAGMVANSPTAKDSLKSVVRTAPVQSAAKTNLESGQAAPQRTATLLERVRASQKR